MDIYISLVQDRHRDIEVKAFTSAVEATAHTIRRFEECVLAPEYIYNNEDLIADDPDYLVSLSYEEGDWALCVRVELQ